MKIAIVTGASSGMGREFVKQISRLYTGLDEIWVIARRRERLTQLQEESMYPLRTLDGDITDPKFLEEFAYLLQATSPDVRMLVNAAGVGSNGTIADLAEINDRLQPEMVRLNCEALLEMTQKVLPYLSEKSRDHQPGIGSGVLSATGICGLCGNQILCSFLFQSIGKRVEEEKDLCDGSLFGTGCYGIFCIGYHEDSCLEKAVPCRVRMPVVRKALIDSGKRKKLSVYGGSMKLVRILTKILPIDFLVWIMGI